MPRKKDGSGKGGQEASGSMDEIAKLFRWVVYDASLINTSPELLGLWPEERRGKAMWWEHASIQEKAEFLTSGEFSNKVTDSTGYGTVVLVRELKGVVVALARQIATLKEERQVEMKAAEQEVIKLRAEVAQRGVRDEKMVTLKAANAEIARRVKNTKEAVTEKANAEMKRRRDEAKEVLGGIQDELDDANEKVRLGEKEKRSLEAAMREAEEKEKCWE